MNRVQNYYEEFFEEICYAVYSKEGLTYDQIGSILNLTGPRVRQIATRALEKMKKYKYLKEYLEEDRWDKVVPRHKCASLSKIEGDNA